MSFGPSLFNLGRSCLNTIQIQTKKRYWGPQILHFIWNKGTVPLFWISNVGTVPRLCILCVGTVPMLWILNVRTIPTFSPSLSLKGRKTWVKGIQVYLTRKLKLFKLQHLETGRGNRISIFDTLKIPIFFVTFNKKISLEFDIYFVSLANC